MSEPRQVVVARIQAQGREARKLAAQLSGFDRAMLVTELLRGVYDAVKFDVPEGGGLDGRDGPERRGLGKLIDASADHAEKMMDVCEGPSTGR